LGEVAGKFGEKGRLALALWLGFFLAGAGELFTDRGEAQAALVQDFGGEALFFAQQAQQKVFGTDVLVREALGFLGCVSEDTLALVAQGKIDRSRDLLTDRGVTFDLFPNGFDGSVRAQEPVGQGLVFTEKSQQEMFGLNIGRSELAGFVPREEDDAPGFFGITFKHIALPWDSRLRRALRRPSPNSLALPHIMQSRGRRTQLPERALCLAA